MVCWFMAFPDVADHGSLSRLDKPHVMFLFHNDINKALRSMFLGGHVAETEVVNGFYIMKL